MSNYAPYSIALGGTLPTGAKLTALTELLGRLCAGDWAGEAGAEAARSELEDASRQQRSAQFFDDSRPGGLHTELTDWCRKHNVAYLVHSGSTGEVGAGYVAWQPGMAEEISGAGDFDSEPALTISEIRQALADGTLEARLTQWEGLAKVPPVVMSTTAPKPRR